MQEHAAKLHATELTKKFELLPSFTCQNVVESSEKIAVEHLNSNQN